MPDKNRRARAAQFIIRSRTERKMFFPPNLFSDPAWDMLLGLYAAALERKPVTLSELGDAADVPLSTARRWADALQGAGMIVRAGGAGAAERFVLSERGWFAADSYFENLSSGKI